LTILQHTSPKHPVSCPIPNLQCSQCGAPLDALL